MGYEIKRDILGELLSHLYKKEITLIIGPRQVGKTTLMKELMKKLERDGERFVYFNLDNEMDFLHFKSQRDFLEKLKLELGEQGFVFIDEIQRKEDAGLFLKGLYDMELSYKFVVSGSGSLELREKMRESLVGRKREFIVTPITLLEFIDYRTEYRYTDRLNNFFKVEKDYAERLLREYMNFGGYPRVILADTLKEKREEIKEIFTGYVEKDIARLLNIDRVDAYIDMIRILSASLAQPISLSTLSQHIGVSFQTLKKYLFFAEKTFIIERLSSFHRNPHKEITKNAKYYFYDQGLRNFAINIFGNVVDFSVNFENLVWQELRFLVMNSSASLYFWRSKDKAEVDFVINTGSEIIPVEVKFVAFKKTQIPRSLRSFINRYKPQKAFVINLDLSAIEKVNDTKLHFLPWWRMWEVGTGLS